ISKRDWSSDVCSSDLDFHFCERRSRFIVGDHSVNLYYTDYYLPLANYCIRSIKRGGNHLSNRRSNHWLFWETRHGYRKSIRFDYVNSVISSDYGLRFIYRVAVSRRLTSTRT